MNDNTKYRLAWIAIFALIIAGIAQIVIAFTLLTKLEGMIVMLCQATIGGICLSFAIWIERWDIKSLIQRMKRKADKP